MQLDRDKIMLLLARQKKTVVSLASDYGVTRNRLYAMLNSRNVTPATAGKLADALGVDVTEIIA